VVVVEETETIVNVRTTL